MTENEGWNYILNSPKWHYFREGRSLCKRWATFAKDGFQQGKNDSPDNCKSCREKLLREQAS